jgi:hypothetical protein
VRLFFGASAVSKVRRDIARRKLSELLARAEPETFFLMTWAIDAIQSGREVDAKQFIQYPAEAVTQNASSPYAVHKWRLESLINEILLSRYRPGLMPFDCLSYEAVADFSNALQKLEEEEDRILSRSGRDILRELSRLIHRQFEWQRGFIHRSQIYRSLFIYGHTDCAKFFLDRYRITVVDFFNCGFAFYATCLSSPGFARDSSFTVVGIDDATRDVAIGLLSTSHEQAQIEAKELRKDQSHAAYKKSVLRTTPIISFGLRQERLRAPLPALIAWRITAGLYYYMVRGGSHIYREIGERFETYCFELSKCMLPIFHVELNVEYKLRGNVVHSPDILVSDGGKVVAAIECKAKKMTFEAKFADDPIAEAKVGYQEIAKGILQLWRFFSHSRQSLTSLELAKNVVGIVVTLDNWLEMSNELRELVTGMANDMADGDIAIQATDRKTIAFCSIEELEVTLQHASPHEFIHAARESVSQRFFGWNLSSVHRELTNGLNRNNPFPFDNRLAELNPAFQKPV